MKTLFQKYRHALVLLYGFIYMPWFMWLESRANLPYHVIHVGLDDLIPFVEYFIVPYLLWFAYVAAVFVYLFLKNRREFYQYCIFLFTGMTLFLIISTDICCGRRISRGTIFLPWRSRSCTRPTRLRIFSRACTYSTPSRRTVPSPIIRRLGKTA